MLLSIKKDDKRARMLDSSEVVLRRHSGTITCREKEHPVLHFESKLGMYQQREKYPSPIIPFKDEAKTNRFKGKI